MRILSSARTCEDAKPSAIAVGVFDGVHRGHRALLSKALTLARDGGLEAMVYTFHPHPAQVLVPAKAPKLIEGIEIRLERFAGMGMDAVILERFGAEFAAISAECFVDDILIGRLKAKHVVVGAGFTFGAGGKGNTDLLRERALVRGCAVHVVSPVEHQGERISSTRIRELVGHGDMRRAADLLGRPFAVIGLAMRGHRRGRGLGFPTANIALDTDLLPKRGVYAAVATGPLGAHQAVVNVGYAPTFGTQPVKIEVHLLDFKDRDLYGTTFAVEFIELLRDEKKFDGTAQLAAQIRDDISHARTILDALRPPE
ncbi:MAG: bifunctional riboflavin kinase/FAD synthetase [Deltaproteobacteria bacterium]|nr:bifunctional riboflavin kinase/FAD synthetase [Deltaproteobacteria bacterium]